MLEIESFIIKIILALSCSSKFVNGAAFDVYDNKDFLVIGLQRLYDPSFARSNGSLTTVPFAMRIDSQDGRVGWVKAFDVKENNQDYDNVKLFFIEYKILFIIIKNFEFKWDLKLKLELKYYN